MKIAAMGMSFEYDHNSIDDLSFSSDTTLLDYEFLIWDPNSLVYDYDVAHNTYKGHICLNDDYSFKIVEDILRRKEEMKNMLELGRSIIVSTPEPQICYIATGQKEYSGTGRNRQTTRIVTELNLLSALPLPAIETFPASGKSIEIREGGPFTSFWEKTKNYLEYKAYFKTSIGKPFLFIKGTQLAVGTHLKISNGNLIFIPTFDPPKDKEEDKEELVENEDYQVEEEFISSLISLIEELKKDTGDFDLPAWSKGYILPSEEEARNTLAGLEKNLEEILIRISRQKNSIAELEKNKLLITGSGRALEVQVKKVLEELGFTVTEGSPGRDDLIINYNGKVAVAEIKGVSKSAAEKHAAQLEKWVSQYYADHSIEPKGILIVNAYKDIPLHKRKEAPFPDQMLDYCKKRDHCLITGQQLLSLYLDCKNNDEKKNKMVDLIFNTKGVFSEYRNWTDYIIFENETTEVSDQVEQ